jgi:hypothetical protein
MKGSARRLSNAVQGAKAMQCKAPWEGSARRLGKAVQGA